MTEKQRRILMIVRSALLQLVDACEEALEMPRTKEMRERLKQLEREARQPGAIVGG